MSLPPGTRLDRYEIRSLLGSGGMGEVYLAQDTSELARTVAVKVLPSELASDLGRMQRFTQEAKVVSSLNHPNILTIHEVGQANALRFIVTEFVDGVTLREHTQGRRVRLHEVLEIAAQVAAALDAAHEAGVFHRDIKPENIMVRRRDHIVKVLDFGLAKPAQATGGARFQQAVDTEAGTRVLAHTEPGLVMGTVSYMSPEQSQGSKHVDHRTDIWSLGVVLYEMVAGQVPFEGRDIHRQVIAIQEREPPPLSRYAEGVPERLEEIVAKALAKDPDDRYQTAKDFLIDLRSLKRKLEVEAEIYRTAPPEVREGATGSGRSVARTASGADATGEVTAPHAASSAEYIVNQVKLHRRGAVLMLAALLLVGAAVAFWYMKRTRAAVLTDKDTILLAEFDNKTGEEVFDGTLRQGLAVQLRQSPFLDIFPDQRVRETLRLMSRSPEERVTRETAREICQRQGLKAYVAGAIAKFDRNYSLTLEALNGQTGDSLAIVQVEAEGKDQVLRALSQAATELREKLGESLSSIKTFDAPLEVTTSSLDALKEYAFARDAHSKGQPARAIEFLKRATEKDPDFASAWLLLAVQHSNTQRLGLAAEYAAKAYALRDRASEIERASITVFYYNYVTGELDKVIEALEAIVRNYPRDATGPGNLAWSYARTGQIEKGVAASHEALRLNPNNVIYYNNLAWHLIQLNRYAEAKEVLQRALAQKFDYTTIRLQLYYLAFIDGDAQAMQEQVAWAGGKPDEHRTVDAQTESASFAGEWRKSQEHLRRSTELALRAEAKEAAAGYTANQALRAVSLGQPAQAITLADAALKIERNRDVLTSAALAFALAGEASRAQTLIQELEQKHPKDTLLNQLWLPEIKAALALRRGDAQAALDLLEPARRFEPVDDFWQKTLRTMAYLKLGKGAKPAAETRKIINRRGEAALSVLWPLAHLNLARASVLQGDAPQARLTYEEFFKLWANADADLPVLVEAKKEYAKLK